MQFIVVESRPCRFMAKKGSIELRSKRIIMKYALMSIETGLDIIGVVLGVLLMMKGHDNRMRFSLGALVTGVSLIFFVDNVQWHIVYYTVSTDLPTRNDLLLFERMAKWFILAHITSLFPLSSLRPGYLTNSRLIVLSIPTGAMLIVTVCYYLFNGLVTPLYSMQDVVRNADLPDVQLRLLMFVVSMLVPIVYFLAPLVGKKDIASRRSTPFMTLFFFSALLILIYHIAFSLYCNDYIFFTYGIVVIVFHIGFAIIFLLYENPLSLRKNLPESNLAIQAEDTLEEKLYMRIMDFLNNKHSFAQPEYALADLAGDIGVRQSLVVAAIKHGGFSGFREFINYVRIEHFKQLANNRFDCSVKELMYECGFRSRTTFYRLFSNYESVTPSEYIDQLAKN